VTPASETPAAATAADLVLAEFRRASQHVPAYQALLEEHGVRAADVRDLETFARLCPVLSKANTFDRFPLPQLAIGGRLEDVGEVLTSSGHGGRFSFGVISRAEAASSAAFVDAALDAAFAVKSKKTLAINCLPMGVVVSSRCMTVATTSVREDMAVALVKAFGADYDQIVLIGDPLFMKRLTDYALEQGLDWRRYRMNAVLGEETFGEHFRHYLERMLGLEPDLAAATSCRRSGSASWACICATRRQRLPGWCDRRAPPDGSR
jgi:phenylacetate-CoA ligase